MEKRMPCIGDIYQEVREDGLYVAFMVVGIIEGTVLAGTGSEYVWSELVNAANWTLIKEGTTRTPAPASKAKSKPKTKSVNPFK